MHPVLLQLTINGRELIIGTYGVMLAAALCSGAAIFISAGKKRGFSFNDSLNIYLIISITSMFGSLAAGFFLFLPERIASGFFDFPHVLVSWGGIIGGISAGLLISKLWKIDFLKLGDVSAPAFLTGIGIGRIGCNFGGCCYGIHSDSFISVIFDHPYAPASSVLQPLVPVQLVSAFILVSGGIIFFTLLGFINSRGLLFGLAMLYYSIFRFIIEFFRDDFRKFIFGYSDAQVFSLFLFAAGLFTIANIFRLKLIDRRI